MSTGQNGTLLLAFSAILVWIIAKKLQICSFIKCPYSLIVDAFIRAIKVSTGEDIDPYVINVVFQLFDIDGKILESIFKAYWRFGSCYCQYHHVN